MVTETQSTSDLTAPASRARVPIPPPDVGDDVLTCAACGAANSADSRFCRKCGDALVVAPVASDAANSKRATDVKRVQTVGDETRARHLLDRAFSLAERGDRAGAILACRQSVALAPDVPQGFSMLGLLLERNGDLQGAANAYTRVLHLAPGSRLEEESLARLHAAMDAASSSRRKTAPAFDFNNADLALAANAAPGAAAPVAAAPVTAPSTSRAPVVAAAMAATAVAATAAPDDKHGTRLLTPATSAVAAAPVQTVAPLSVPAVSALDFDVMDEPRAPLWRQIAARPTFYWSGLPLAGAALLGLLVMSWGRSSALSRQVVAPTTATSSTANEVPKDTNAPANNPTNNAGVPDYSVNTPPGAVGGAGLNEAYQFGSAPRPAPANNAPVAPNGQNAPANNTPNRANNAANNQRSTNRAPSAPPRASNPRPSFPSPSAPLISPAMPSQLPPVRTPATQSGSGAIEVTPSYGQSNSNVASSGGAPFGASNSKSNNYITLTRPRSPAAAAPRPSNNANSAERAAANAGSSGRGNNAIDSINSALQNGGDTGWRYQQRALLFLERGDNQRAADDFQTAIGAYRDQINRGERVSEAKAGIQACQSGLRLALANAR